VADVSRFDVVIVGAGPAGIAATQFASFGTSSIAVIDQSPEPGGQIWRRDWSAPRPANTLIESVQERTTFIGGASVVDAVTENGRHRLLVQRGETTMIVESATLILAPGARELFLPFPGWTLPGVVGVGGLQALMKSGLDVRGRRIVVAGSGPLLLAVAAAAVRRGADVVAVVEQVELAAMARFGARLAFRPKIAIQALMYFQHLGGGVQRFGSWVSSAHGGDRVTAATIRDGTQEQKVDCDIIATGYGLVPNLEIAKRLGCAVHAAGIVVDDQQRTSIPGIYAAGECTGIGGVEKSFLEGSVAGALAVGGPVAGGSRLLLKRARWWGESLERTFAPRPEVLALAHPSTVICRCEDVRLRDLDRAGSARQAKLHARAGMGACQGRVCGAALQSIFGWSPDTVRPPLQPTTVSSLLGAS
jgi:NADPH-dependent 2,4-dienoyl-CoA reductase/sulfur reductase-like enzyme